MISFQIFFVWVFKILVDFWKFTIILLYILWNDWPIFMISDYDFRFKWTAAAAIGIHPPKTWLSQQVNFKNPIWHFIRTIGNKILFWTCKKKATETYGMFQTTLDQLAGIEHQFLSGIRDSRKTGSLWGMIRGVGGVRKSIHQSW